MYKSLTDNLIIEQHINVIAHISDYVSIASINYTTDFSVAILHFICNLMGTRINIIIPVIVQCANQSRRETSFSFLKGYQCLETREIKAYRQRMIIKRSQTLGLGATVKHSKSHPCRT